MDMEVNLGSVNDISSIGDGAGDFKYVSEWMYEKDCLQLEAEEDKSQPPSPKYSCDGPSDQQDLPVELHCEEEENNNIYCQQHDSTPAGVFITSSTNFDLQCEDEDQELHASEHAKGTQERINEDCEDTKIIDSYGQKELAPTSESVMLYYHKDCGDFFHDLSKLQEHQQYDVAECSYQCPICGKEFFHTANLRMHRLVHLSDRPYNCPECDKGFTHKVDLWRHLRNVHKIEHSKTLTNEPSVTSSSVNQNQSSKCTVSQVRSGEPDRNQPKPYLCPICGKGFRTSNLLSKHKVIHRQDKPYECQECGKAFVQMLRLRRHQKIHTGERPFHCEECGRTFTRLTSLHRHQRIHTGEKPYSCEYCAQDFTESGSLRRHERIHQMKTS
uniref:C2H2-type domain-containing protein n=1 Tax=Salvator merianae TaxID=96440 RepID=A0A8D0BXE2_SALMN